MLACVLNYDEILINPFYVLIERYVLYVNFSLNLTTVMARYVTIILFVCMHFIFSQWFVRISEMLGEGSYRPNCSRQRWGKRVFGVPILSFKCNLARLSVC